MHMHMHIHCLWRPFHCFSTVCTVFGRHLAVQAEIVYQKYFYLFVTPAIVIADPLNTLLLEVHSNIIVRCVGVALIKVSQTPQFLPPFLTLMFVVHCCSLIGQHHTVDAGVILTGQRRHKDSYICTYTAYECCKTPDMCLELVYDEPT